MRFTLVADTVVAVPLYSVIDQSEELQLIKQSSIRVDCWTGAAGSERWRTIMKRSAFFAELIFIGNT